MKKDAGGKERKEEKGRTIDLGPYELHEVYYVYINITF